MTESAGPQAFDCPQCGANLPPTEAQTVMCAYCGNTINVPRRPAPVVQVNFTAARPSAAPVAVAGAAAGAAVGAGAVGIVVFGAIMAMVILFIAGLLVFTAASPNLPMANGVADLVRTLGTAGTANGELDDARQIAVDADGAVYVGDYGDGRITKFAPSGEFALTLQIPRENPYLSDIVVDGTGRLYASARGDIYIFDTATGKLTDTWEQSFPETYYGVMALDQQDHLYVANGLGKQDTLLQLSRAGKVTARWDEFISKTDPSGAILSSPELALAITSDDMVYALEMHSGVLLAYNPEGEFQGRVQNEKGWEFSESLTLDPQGRLLVVTATGVDVLNKDGQVLKNLPREFQYGTFRDAAVDTHGDVYIVSSSGQVLVYRFKDNGQ